MYMKNKMIYLLCLLVISKCFSIQQQSRDSLNGVSENLNTTKILWPLPKRISSQSISQDILFDLSDISFKIEAVGDENINTVLLHYIVNIFKLPKVNYIKSEQKSAGQQIIMNIVVKNTRQVVPQDIQHQKYQLTIRQNQRWELIADYFPGFVRGFQTFSQLFQKQKNGKYLIRNRPVLIDDQPDFLWRGLMIDTSRHFLPVERILKIVDGIMYNKMNVLHWHIIDQDSFPMEIPSRPEISKYGALKGVYSANDLKKIQDYANARAIRVIPEYDTPAHTRSWGRSPELEKLTFEGWIPYHGQFDPTINLTYEVVSDVTQYVNSIFKDKYVHLGGDQVDFDVWDKHPQIKQWMTKMNISDYDQLQVYYRKKQRQILRSVNPTKKAIYWANEEIDLPVDLTDVIQWWGETENLDKLKTRKNQIILSNYDLAYLDVGFGDELGDPYRTHISWRDIYKFTPKIEGVNVIGGQACMWAETVYEGNIEQKIWIRSSSFAERLWNLNIDINKNILNIVQRLIQQKKRMQSRGFKVSPVTVGLCQKDPSICFS